MVDTNLNIIARAIDEVSKPMLAASKSFEAASKTITDQLNRIAEAQENQKKSITWTVDLVSAAGAVKNAIGSIFGAVEDAGQGLFNLAKHAAEAGDQAKTLADRAGVSSEFMTRMGFAAQQSGSSMEAVQSAMGILSKNALSGSKDFARWGLSIKDSGGHLKSTEQLTKDAFEKIASLKSPLERAAAAQNLFGKSGKDLLPMLADGSKGLQEMMAEADKVGATISTTSGIVGDMFNDDLHSMNTSIDAVSRTVGEVFEPVFVAAFRTVTDIAGKFRGEIDKNRDTIRQYVEKGVLMLVDGLVLVEKGAKFVVQGIDGIRVVLAAASLVQAEMIDGMVAGFETLLTPISLVLDGLKAMGKIDTNPLKDGFESVRDVTKGVVLDAEREYDAVQASALEHERWADVIIAGTEKAKVALKENISKVYDEITAKTKAAQEAAKRPPSGGTIDPNSEAARKAREKAIKEHTEALKLMEQADREAFKKRLEMTEAQYKRASELETANDVRVLDASKELFDHISKHPENLQKLWALYYASRNQMSREGDQKLLEQIQETERHIREQHVHELSNIIQSTYAALKNSFDGIGHVVTETETRITKNAQGFLEETQVVVATHVKTVTDWLMELPGIFLDKVLESLEKKMADKIADKMADFLLDLIPGGSIIGEFLGFNKGGLVPMFADGGVVTGGMAGRDSVPALLTPGEYVLPKHVVDSIRHGSPPATNRFAQGGPVVATSGTAMRVQNTNISVLAFTSSPAQLRKVQRDLLEPSRSQLKRNRIIKGG